ncbi:MAG: nucleotide-binding universal stress UspA family protein [Dokdonia sp.]|jgi:nucleotide-binding universal stress UspA family protein
MNTQSLKSKHRLLVLLDKSKASYNALKNAVNLAKLIDGSIDILQVKSPTSVVKYENQIASMRAIDEERTKQKKELKELAVLLCKEEGLPVSCNFTFGNVKNEIKNHIEKTQPDIIVLGKRKKKVVNFLGDGITEDLLKTYNGGILISGSKEAFTSYNNKSIGFLNNTDGIESIAITDDLKRLTQKPLKIFKINQEEFASTKKSGGSKIKEQEVKEDTIVYEFDANGDTASGMANFISKNNLALLCINKNDEHNRSILGRLNKILTKTIEKTNIPVLILNSN